MRRNLLITSCVLLAVGLALIYNRRDVPIGNDTGGYLQMAQGADVKGLWPPLFPLLGSLALRVGFDSLNIISLISLAFLIVLIVHISRTLKLGIIPAFLVALCPAVFAFGWAGMSEMLFTLLMTLAIWLFISTEKWWHGLLAGVCAILAYQTRYIGQFLILWMLLVLIKNRSQGKVLAFLVSGLGVAASIAFNYWRYGMMSGERPESKATLISTIKSLGLAVWSTWIGDGPMMKFSFWPLAIVGLIGLGWALWERSPFSLAALCYLALLFIGQLSVRLDPPNRRYLMPIVPLIILTAYPRLKLWRVAMLVIASLVAIAHAFRGAIA